MVNKVYWKHWDNIMLRVVTCVVVECWQFGIYMNIRSLEI